jgi:hypothetical protein
LYGVIPFFETDLLGRTQWTGWLGIPWDDQDVSTNTTLVSGLAEREREGSVGIKLSRVQVNV